MTYIRYILDRFDYLTHPYIYEVTISHCTKGRKKYKGQSRTDHKQLSLPSRMPAVRTVGKNYIQTTANHSAVAGQIKRAITLNPII
jgi:hypothetical protein